MSEGLQAASFDVFPWSHVYFVPALYFYVNMNYNSYFLDICRSRSMTSKETIKLKQLVFKEG
jgi:hypothetical protein